MPNKNSKNLDYCDSCDSCNYCNYCDSCNYCDYCDSCDSCNYCDYCDSCDSCNSCDSCDFSNGLRMSERMIFCLGDGRWELEGEGYQKNNRIFNKEVSEDKFNKAKDSKPEFKLPISVWVDIKDIENPNTTQSQLGGYLKTLSYKNAWKEGWNNASKEFKNWVNALPNFDEKIFKEITGLDIQEEVTIKISKKSLEALKESGIEIIK